MYIYIYMYIYIIKLSKDIHIHFALEKEIRKIAILKKHTEALRSILKGLNLS